MASEEKIMRLRKEIDRLQNEIDKLEAGYGVAERHELSAISNQLKKLYNEKTKLVKERELEQKEIARKVRLNIEASRKARIASERRARILRNIRASERGRLASRFGGFGKAEKIIQNLKESAHARRASRFENFGESEKRLQQQQEEFRRQREIAPAGVREWAEDQRREVPSARIPTEISTENIPLVARVGTPRQPPRSIIPLTGEGSRYGWWTWIIVILAILIAVSFLFTNPLNFISFLGPFWLVIIAAILLAIVLFFSARGKNVSLGWFFSSIWTFLTDHWKLILIVIAILLLVYYSFGPLLASGVTEISGALAANAYFRWIIVGIFVVLGLYLIFKKGKDEKNPYPYRKLGIAIFVFAILFGWLYEALFDLIGVTFTDLYGFRWIISLVLGILGIWALVHKDAQGRHTASLLGVLLIIAAFVFWIIVPFFSSSLFEKYGLQGIITVEESGLGKRLERFWFYAKNPEKYFASFGEFTNPQAKEKKAPVGLIIEKFESVVKTFRTDQEIRLTAEMKHFALPKFEEGREEDNKIKAGIGCYIFEGNDPLKETDVEIRSSVGTSRETSEIPALDKHKNSTFFIFCNLEEGKLTMDKGKNETAKRAKLNVTYFDFITESILKVYYLGKTKYDEIILRENADLEFLNLLRNSASYPALVNNERKTISEYSSGPVKLSVNILNEQPLTSENGYTLIIRSEPNSIDWEGNIKVNSIFLDVPSWFSPKDDQCAFTSGSGASSGLKRLELKESEKRGLYICEGNISVASGCSYFCDFTIDGREDIKNVEEFNIRAVQKTDYTLEKSTVFSLVRSVFGREGDEFKDESLEGSSELEESPKSGISEPVVKSNVRSICGDGKIYSIEGPPVEGEVFELCDDNNSLNGDGCSSTCEIEVGYTCTEEPSVCSRLGPVIG